MPQCRLPYGVRGLLLVHSKAHFPSTWLQTTAVAGIKREILNVKSFRPPAACLAQTAPFHRFLSSRNGQSAAEVASSVPLSAEVKAIPAEQELEPGAAVRDAQHKAFSAANPR